MPTRSTVVAPAPIAARQRGLDRARTLVIAEVTGFLGLFGIILFAYWLLGYPIYNDIAWLDPWYYTGIWVDYDFLHAAFHGSYYVTRIPWIAPGRIVFAIMRPDAAYLFIHIVYGVVAAGALYLLLRRFLGRYAAAAGVAITALNPLVYHTFYRDYVVAGEATYLLLALYFGVAGRGGRRPGLSMAGAGFFVAAAFATHFFSAMFSSLLVVPYAIVYRPRLRQLAFDAGSFAGGFALLMVLCGIYSKAFNGPFNFLGPAFHTTTDLELARYHVPGYSWMLAEPRFLVPPLLFVLVPLLLRGRRADWSEATRRFVYGIYAYSALLWLIVTIWEVAGGFIYENIDYNEAWTIVGVVPLLGIAAGLLVAALRRRGLGAGAVALVTVAAFVPPFLLYRLEHTSWGGRPASVVTLVGIALTLAGAVGARFRIAVSAAAAVVLLTATTAYAFTGSAQVLTTMDYTSSRTEFNRGAFNVGIQWMRWMQDEGLQDQYMETWFNLQQMPWGVGLASFYFYGWILQGDKMPTIDAAFRQTWKQRTPSEIVMLCKQADCGGAVGALRRAGYPVTPKAAHHFTSGPVSLWVRVVKVVGGGPP